jgi:hypothetical protein
MMSSQAASDALEDHLSMRLDYSQDAPEGIKALGPVVLGIAIALMLSRKRMAISLRKSPQATLERENAPARQTFAAGPREEGRPS